MDKTCKTPHPKPVNYLKLTKGFKSWVHYFNEAGLEYKAQFKRWPRVIRIPAVFKDSFVVEMTGLFPGVDGVTVPDILTADVEFNGYRIEFWNRGYVELSRK